MISKISTAISRIFTHKKLDDETLEQLEETLILGDLGIEVTQQIISHLKAQKFGKNIGDDEVRKFLAQEIEKILKPCEGKLDIDEMAKPYVIIFNGVNGVGKTTTIGKIAAKLKNQNKKILIAACDTFRAAASEQLAIWANKVGCEIILPQKEAEDPASVAYRALDFARKNNFDVLLIDTAGRLQNKQNLMDELKKINLVLKKLDSAAPHQNLLILDATTGQNARSQMEIFNQIVGITGLIITKLDGSAKGGVVVALAQKFQKPVYAIGVGEKDGDLREFDAEDFVRNLIY
ncbi:MAG: signal recognition particle-docking protein FtsY [Alphaproteobacteria bacterium RIFCSPLOWO2_01_FULL_40_26]|nr:MAG: signal recognition particle-docking protein FtsY [Alphaproteobacteria bacterium RIFCSPHIGHO2_02_FULL_40_34]OFW94694.1 MAG: signal recognition particle-docking protein FtsY [Alphaproteobacteria bacterium RIFCSPLOWO2_01_FULL_40_26]OFX10162.1 MAG: signal recognition particle-docking protein FtsY [Alphaproteobacteria bacterium RIFCSPLOWO2_02_FULL_40_19]OFX11791.1 MAG: signal recognition particle-docking protein FtsY [Alphaproteobacteria bacterium RIFCSPLOWO2_12_FULL_40_11]